MTTITAKAKSGAGGNFTVDAVYTSIVVGVAGVVFINDIGKPDDISFGFLNDASRWEIQTILATQTVQVYP